MPPWSFAALGPAEWVERTGSTGDERRGQRAAAVAGLCVTAAAGEARPEGWAGRIVAPLAPDGDQLPVGVLKMALWLSLWIASGSLVLAVASRLGANPVRRTLVGVALILVCAVALWLRATVCDWFREQPWLVVAVAAVELGVVALDGLIGTPYVAFSLTSVGIAVIVARSRTVWVCVSLLDVGYATVLLLGNAPSSLARHGELGGVIGALVSYPFAALVLLSLRRLFSGFVESADGTLDVIRRGDAMLTPALALAVRRAGRAPLGLPPAPSLAELLSPAELRVVEGLAGGNAPKEIAHRLGVSLPTVRTHIKHAKRKAGARTLRELAAMAAQLHAPEAGERAG